MAWFKQGGAMRPLRSGCVTS